MIALVDCNNFFVSVERVFDPSLKHKPVAVLSSNDGCVIARSNDIKSFIPMGVPVFKVRDTLRHHGVVLKSSNFALYSDMSRRVTAILGEFSPEVDVYSVDEAFLDLPYWVDPCQIRATVLRKVGIPVSVGCAVTRTLAKAAAELAKQDTGVLDLARINEEKANQHLSRLPIEDTWGVGSKLAKRFRMQRVNTAYDLKIFPEPLLKQYSITVRRMVYELRGFPMEEAKSAHSKSMISTRSFGEPVDSKASLLESVSSHASHIGVKLRQEGLMAGRIDAFASTGKNGATLVDSYRFPVVTDDNRELIRAAKYILSRVYCAGLQYKKAGVLAYDLTPVQQLAFDSDDTYLDHAKVLSQTLDIVNGRWGSRTLRFGAEGINQSWHPRHDLRSPRYTTEWDELKRVA